MNDRVRRKMQVRERERESITLFWRTFENKCMLLLMFKLPTHSCCNLNFLFYQKENNVNYIGLAIDILLLSKGNEGFTSNTLLLQKQDLLKISKGSTNSWRLTRAHQSSWTQPNHCSPCRWWFTTCWIGHFQLKRTIQEQNKIFSMTSDFCFLKKFETFI